MHFNYAKKETNTPPPPQKKNVKQKRKKGGKCKPNALQYFTGSFTNAERRDRDMSRHG